MKTYTFKAIVEKDEGKWVSYVPELKDKGGASWGRTKEEALKNLEEVIRLVLEDMAECKELEPLEKDLKKKGVIISSKPLISVIV
ncbi:MAG: type II toxin-antitoxin system HicB family antitoxin [Candidatus Thermoplasmatota archaeon]|nr:type II toxin-antitoxin system HicB family antitoxin [Candidatus Thermoplasmatota archaeon]